MNIQSSTKAWKWQVVFLFLCYSWGWVIGQLHYSIYEELQPGTFVGNIMQDLGLTPSDIIKGRLQLGPESNSRYFDVDQGSGVLTVKNRIDRESLCGSSRSCFLHLDAVTEIPVQLFSVEIEILDINDNSPAFSNTNRILRITELVTIPGVQFPLEIAQDADIGMNSVTQYRLNANPFFSLSVKTRKDGTLMPELILEKIVDREEKKEHKLILTAIDSGEQPRSGSSQISVIVLDINDNAPVFDESLYRISLLENAPPKTVIITMNATDLDEGDNSEIEYYFDDHTSDSAKRLFDINTKTGEIFIKGLVDYEDSHYWELSIRAVDKGIPELEGRCIVQVEIQDINDNPPEIIFTSATNAVPEDAALGTVIGFLVVTDKDSGKNGEILLEASPNLPFKFHHLKNRHSLVTDGWLDREKHAQYEIIVTASDLGSPPLHTQTKITLKISDVNDNPPVIQQSAYNAFIKENNESGSLLCTVSASDLDEGVNSELTYSVVESQIDGFSVSSFVYINSESGKIFAQRSFDYEHTQVLNITVKVEDSGSPRLSSNASVFIFVLDVNDNYPTVLYLDNSGERIHQPKIPKSAAAGYLVTKLSAVDKDSGRNAWLHYRLVDYTNSRLFQVSEASGEIRTLQGLEEVDILEQKLVISVSDHGEPSMSTTVTLLVNILDSVVNESPKSQDLLTNSMPTSDMTLYLIISIAAISLVSLITFFILIWKCLKREDGGSSCGFCVPSKSGPKHYMDHYKPTLFLNNDGTLKYMEVRMVPPETQGPCYPTCYPSTTENDFTFMKPLDFPHLKDLASEGDASSSNTMVNGSSQGNGDLVVKERLDRETLCESGVSCSVTLEIITEEPLELFGLEIEILDINDNSPKFSTNVQTIRILEALASPGTRFPLESAQDLDMGTYGVSQYMLTSSPYFKLSVKKRKDGTMIPELIVEKILDREEQASHKLLITAVDDGKPPKSGTSEINVIVLDINDNAHVFYHSIYKVTLRENTTPKTSVLKLNVTDLDKGLNGVIEYFFDYHTLDSVKYFFYLNQQTGEISAKGVVDYEGTDFYEISIRAKDKGIPEMDSRCVVFIEIEDVLWF
ncbi:protocadherin gamma-C5-like [Rhinoderma darwinii]|uniref:protocadherin gamma-C5-like n=1 Tax=Rhinoderma darwinii TaxID=43563 RepID=UPI003F6711C2